MDQEVKTKENGHVKTERKRKPWVYKSEYDRVVKLLGFAALLAVAGWLAFAVALSYAL